MANNLSKIFFITAGISVFLIILVLYVVFALPSENGLPVNTQPSPNEVADTQNTTTVAGPGLPVELSIPSIKVNAPIIYVGLAADGSVAVPKGPHETAWFKLGPRPGEKGSAVITGHFGPWQTGAKSVFDNLYQLKKGDQIRVKDDKGEVLIFTVRESRIYKPEESPPEVFAKNDGVYLNLITCNGDWLKNQKTYTQRLVVFADIAK